jgi:hypothetical protein
VLPKIEQECIDICNRLESIIEVIRNFELLENVELHLVQNIVHFGFVPVSQTIF